MINNLLIFLPVYNEEESIEYSINSWVSEIDRHIGNNNYHILAINDGSKDQTFNILAKLGGKYQNLKIINKENEGHGKSIVFGYRYALENGYSYVMQIDSDGQCNPHYFKQLLEKFITNTSIPVYGFRYKRKDGYKRLVISRIVSGIAFLSTGIWVRDANVPYRLFSVNTLEKYLDSGPENMFLSNVALSVYHKKMCGIEWVPIIFDDRYGGSPSLSTFRIMTHGLVFVKQIRQFVKNIR